MRRHTLRPAQHCAPVVNDANLSRRLTSTDHTPARIEKIENLARQWHLHHLFPGQRLRVVEQNKNLRSRYLSMNGFVFDGQPIPDLLANIGCFFMKQLRDSTFARCWKAQTNPSRWCGHQSLS